MRPPRFLRRRKRHYVTRGEFAWDFLRGVRAPITEHTKRAMMAWMQAEGDAARFNPLNTTHDAPGATNFNDTGVKDYISKAQGVAMTVETLDYGADRGKYGYDRVRHRLRSNASAESILEAVEESAWGTGGLALKVLRESTSEFLESLQHHRIVQ